MNKTIYNKVFTLSIIISLLFLISCDIGLGPAVDTMGPSVEIKTPFARENVKNSFNITGTVFDDTSINSLSINCGGNEWINEGGKWKVKFENSDTWTIDNNASWNVQGDGKTINWEITNIDFSLKESGPYDIIASAVDSSGNTSASSKKTRTIIVDKSAPIVTISNPIHKQNSSDFDSLTNYQDITKINNFVTNDFTITGTTTDENSILYVDIYLVDQSCTSLNESDKIYFQQRLYQDEAYKNEDNAPSNSKQIDSLRAWDCEVKISDFTSSFQTKYNTGDKNVLKVLTKTKDASGNSDEANITSHGYICLWKNADNPWIVINLGTNANPSSAYAGSSIMGNAYDDTCVSKIYVTIRENSDSGAYYQDDEGQFYNKKEIYSGTEENNVFFNITAPKDCKKYYIKIETIDNKNNNATAKTGYIKVEDKTFPSIEIKHEVNNIEQSNSNTLFGNDEGTFKFVITAKDDTQVKSLLLAYIKEETDIVDYADKDFDDWSDSNKVISLDIIDTGLTTTENGIKRKIYKAEKEINLFTDLGINGTTNKHSNQSFMFRVEDGNGNAITKDYNILGDIETPEIIFDKIEYTHEGTTKTYTSTTTTLPAFQTGDSVKVYGKIRDNAIDNWNWDTIQNKWKLATNESLFTVKCNETIISPVINQTKKLINGKYYYEWTATKTNLKGASLVYNASLSDLNGNEIIQSYAFLVDTQTPKVDYIYTSKSDGCYGEGTEIPILIRFNMQFKFTKGSDSPTIFLNNNKTLTMEDVSILGEREFKFIYTVQNTDPDTELLNLVTKSNIGIDFKGGQITDLKGNNVTSTVTTLINNAIKNNSGINLKDKKKITIITKPLAIIEDGIKLTESGDVTTVELTYNRNVSKGNGDITITQQNVLNVPPVLSETDYKKYSAIQSYYELTTNSASSSFVADLTPKYVLKYEYNAKRSDEDELLNKYKSTNQHILKQNVKTNKVTINGAKVTIKLGKLPVKGAEYLIEIPEGFVQDAKGGSAFLSAAKSQIANSSGIETPIIRIQNSDATISAQGAGFVATQPLTAKFKVDCETPEVTLNSSYSLEEYGERRFRNDSFQAKPTPTKKNENNLGSNEITIGNDINFDKGLVYKITATASKNGKNEKGYALAQRTTIRISNTNFNYRSGNMNHSSENWPEVDINSKKIGLFLRGGDNLTGGNTTPGLPTSWDPKEYDKALLFTEEGNNLYIVSWKITNNLYFLPLAGQMDEQTYSGGVYKGPKYTCNAQNGFITVYSNFYAEPGSYTVVENTNCGDNQNIQFEVRDAGKAQMVR